MVLFICGIRLGINDTAWAWSPKPIEDKRILSGHWTNLVGLERCSMPMVAIFSLNMTLQSFGYEAEEQIQAENTKDCLVFMDFMRKIFCAGPKVVEHITAKNGKVVSSEELMLNILQYIMATNPIEKCDTLFVLTVPSATSDLHGARQFLKIVAKKAGTLDVLVISEATANLYCCKLEDVFSKEEQIDGKLTVILECEDDYINCSVVQRNVEDSMETLCKTSLNVPSFLHIKQNLELMLVKVWGKEPLDELANDREEYNDFVHNIRTELAHAGDKTPITLNLPWPFIKHKLQQSTLEGMDIYRSKLRLFPNVIRSIFKEVGENISYLLETSLKEVTMAKDQTVSIIFVGNLSRSIILQNIIKSAFPAHVLITLKDPDPGVDVVKGAVLFGKLMKKINKMEDESVAASPNTCGTTSPAQCAVGETVVTNDTPQKLKIDEKKKSWCVVS